MQSSTTKSTPQKLIRLGLVLKKFRLENKMTLEEVAHRLGVTHKAVQFWEQGKTEIRLTTICNLAAIYNTTLITLLQQSDFDS